MQKRGEEQMAYLRRWHDIHQKIDQVYTSDDFDDPGLKTQNARRNM